MHPMYAPYGVYTNTAGQWFELTANAKKVRRYLEEYFIQNGWGPNVEQIMREGGLTQDQTWHSLWELERAVQVMFVPGTDNIIKMPPFSNVPTRHLVSVDGKHKGYAGCAGEACAIRGLFPGKTVSIDSSCPDCWEPVSLKVKDRQLLHLEPATAVIHIGIHPSRKRENWIVTCDNINFFPSKEHVDAWVKVFPEKRGVIMPADMGPGWVDGMAEMRYYDYDRGPDIPIAAAIIGRFREMGLDVSAWE